MFETAPPTGVDTPDNGGVGGGGGEGGVGIGNGGGSGGPKGASVPEPGTMLLVGSGLAIAALSRRKRKNAGTTAV